MTNELTLQWRGLRDKLMRGDEEQETVPVMIETGDMLVREIERLTRERDVSRAAIEQLHAAVKTAQELAARRLMEIEKLRKALKVAQQSLIEFRHAQECGPSWYTRGANGMYQQVSLWLRRGLEAVKDALGPYDDNGQYLKEMPAHEPLQQRSGEFIEYPKPPYVFRGDSGKIECPMCAGDGSVYPPDEGASQDASSEPK